jgi:hypothetical protein
MVKKKERGGGDCVQSLWVNHELCISYSLIACLKKVPFV